jgi:hypothetical protein
MVVFAVDIKYDVQIPVCQEAVQLRRHGKAMTQSGKEEAAIQVGAVTARE